MDKKRLLASIKHTRTLIRLSDPDDKEKIKRLKIILENQKQELGGNKNA